MDTELQKLKEENEKLRNINSFKSDFISISAHELRTALTALKWILKMFMDKDLGELTPEQNDLIKKAFTSNERMIDLVNKMLSLNHTEDIDFKYKFERIDILPLIESILFEFTGESYKKGVEVIFLKPEEKINDVLIDSGIFRVVVQNLIENSIKYNNPGERVFISVRNAGDMVELTVKDTGIGISENDKPKIFEKFFRAKNALAKETVGSGLGLFTTKNIVEKHGGKIWFESKEGSGTTFFVSIPVAK